MKKKDLAELKNKSEEQLATMAADLQKTKTGKTLELASGKLKNVHAVSQTRKDIAQVLSILNIKIFAKRSQIKNAAD